MVGRGGIKQWLHPDRITGEQQKIAPQVEDGKREDAIHFLYTRRAHLLIQVNNYFGIGARMKPMTAWFKTCSKVLEIVNLAIEDKPNGTVFVRHRLPAVLGDVDDCQAVVAERNTLRNRRGPEAANIHSVWSTMTDRTRHAFNRGLEVHFAEVLYG